MKNWHKIFKFTLLQALKGSKYISSTVIVGIIILIATFVSDFYILGAMDKESKVKSLENVYVINETELSIDNESFISKHKEDYPLLKISEISDMSAKAAASDSKLMGEKEAHSIVLEIAEDEESCNLTVYTPGESTIGRSEAEDFAKEYSEAVKNAKVKSSGVSEEKVNMAISDISISQVKAKDSEVDDDDSLLASFTQMGVVMVIYFLIVFYGQSIGQIVSMEKTSKLMEYMLTLTGPSGIIFGKVTAIFCEAVIQIAIWVLCGFCGIFAGDTVSARITGEQGKNLISSFMEMLPEGSISHNFAVLLILAVIAMMAAFLFYSFISALFASFAATAEDLTQTNGLTMLAMITGFLLSMYIPLFTDNSEVALTIVRLIPLTAAFVLPGDVISGRIGIVGFILYLALLVFFTVMLAILTGRVYKNRLFKRGTKGIFDEILAAITGKTVDKADDADKEERKVPEACYDNYDNAKKTYTIVGFSLLALMLGGNVIGGLVGNVIANMMAAAKDMDLMSVYEDKTFLVVENIVGMYVIAMPLCALFMKLTNDSVCKVKGTIEKNLYIRLIFIMFPVTYGLAYFSNFIASALSKGEAENPLINNFLSESNVWAVIMVAFLAPIFEELVFRKLIIDRTRRYGEVLAIVYSSVAFGLFHCNVYQIFYAFAIGLILGYVYVRTGNVILTIIIHMIMNSSSAILYPLVPEAYTYFQYIVIALGIVSIIYTLIKRDIKLETVNAYGSSKELSHIAFANAGSILFSVVCILFMIYSLFAPILLG